MDKVFMKAFCSWLSEASMEELLIKQQAALTARKLVSDENALATASVILRLIDEELVVRSNLLQLKAVV